MDNADSQVEVYLTKNPETFLPRLFGDAQKLGIIALPVLLSFRIEPDPLMNVMRNLNSAQNIKPQAMNRHEVVVKDS
jgi:hypothetical protein